MSDVQKLDHIIEEMIDVVENSKEEIIHISETARQEHDTLLAELVDTKEKVLRYIEKGDQLERIVRASRRRLSEVSKNFDKYSEKEIREVYENTHRLQTELAMLSQEEKALRLKRDDLERRLIALNYTIERATGLTRKISAVLTYLQDDFKFVNEIIEDAREKQEFSLKIIQAQEEERRRISREIHDGPAQMLANILLRSELIEKAANKGDIEHAIEELKNIREMVRSTLYEVRHIIYDLRPMALDDLGLVPTIKRYIATTSEYHQIEIDFKPIGKITRLSQEYEIAFFRLLQESIQNAIKHAEASQIKVRLEIGEKTVTMVVQDDGKGFDPTLKYENSFGLVGMRERVDMLNGEITIDSKIGKGTRIYIQVPYEPE